MEPIQFDVEMDGKTVKFVIKPETLEIQRKCDSEYSVAFVQAIQAGVPPRSVLEKMLKDAGMWSEKDEQNLKTLQAEIVRLEMELAEANTIDAGLPIARQLADLRGRLIEVTQQKGEILNNSAEHMAEQVRRDAFLAYGTYYLDTNKRAYKDYADFISRADEPIALGARKAIARHLFNEISTFIDGLPEAQYRDADNVSPGVMSEVVGALTEARKTEKAKPKKKTTRKKKSTTK